MPREPNSPGHWIKRWDGSPIDEILVYLTTCSCFMKVTLLQRRLNVQPFDRVNSNITIECRRVPYYLAFTVDEVIKHVVGAVPHSLADIEGIEFVFLCRNRSAPTASMDATTIDYLLWRSLIISYRERTQTLFQKAFSDPPAEVNFLRALRNAFSHDGRVKQETVTDKAVWRNLHLGSHVGEIVYPTLLMPGDLLLLLYDVDQLLRAKLGA